MQAQQLLDTINRESHRHTMSGYLDRANSCLDRGDVPCANELLAEAKATGAEPAELYEVRKRIDTMIENREAQSIQLARDIQVSLNAASACFRKNDYDCALDRADEVLTLDSGNASAIEIQQSVKLALAQQQTNEKTVNNFLSEAETCYQKKNYSCAIAKSESALAIIPGFGAANTMKRKATDSQTKAKSSISIK